MRKIIKGDGDPVDVDVFIGGAPLLEVKLCQGLVEFGQRHPRWRFTMRGSNFRYKGGWLEKHHLSGVLVLIDSKPVSHALDSAGIPWVHLLPGRPVKQPNVGVDDRAIGRLGAEFFMQKGFMRCGFCGVGNFWSTERAAGFRSRLADAGRDSAFIDIPFELGLDWGFPPGTERRLRRWVAGLGRGTALMAAHDALANRLVDICIREGLRIPQDIVVLGVGNHDLLCKISPVPISSVDTAVSKVAVHGAMMLETMILGKEPGPSPLISPAGIEERRSTEVVAYGDDLVARAVSHIRDHACGRMTVDNLSKMFSVSRRTLLRRFKKYVGHSMEKEIALARLRHAKDMISRTSMPLSEIAYACGYTDLPHMCRRFRAALGRSPKDFKETPLSSPFQLNNS